MSAGVASILGGLGALGCVALAASCSHSPTILPDPRVRIDVPVEIELASSVPPVIVATIDGRPGLEFLVDTGAEISSINLSFAKEQGFEIHPYSGSGRTHGSDGRSIEYDGYVSLNRIEIGSFAIADLHVPAIDSEVTKIHRWFGILGQDVLGRMIFVLDAERGRIHVLPASTDQEGITRYLGDAKLGAGQWVVAPVEFRPTPIMKFDVAKLEGGELEMEIDTGATSTSLPGPAIAALELEETGTYWADGIAGRLEGKRYRLQNLGLYGLRISGEVQDCNLSYGLFGMNILRALVVVFDAPHGRVWFHNRKGPAPEEAEKERDEAAQPSEGEDR